MIIVIDILLKLLIDKVKCIHRLKALVVASFPGLCHIGLGCIEKNSLLERLCPRHLHLNKKLPFLVVPATDVNDTILLDFCALGDLLGGPVFDAFHMLVVLQGQKCIKKAYDEMRMLAENLLKG